MKEKMVTLFKKNALLEIVVGDYVLGINEEFNALQAIFFFKIGNTIIPRKGFIGCPNATMVWALKASRLIRNQSYEEREITIYGSGIDLVFRLKDEKNLELTFIGNGKVVYRHYEKYLQVLKTILNAAIRSQKVLENYELNTMAEHVIKKEIRLMEQHIRSIDNSEET